MGKILYFISEDWNVLSHFQPMLAAAREAGLEVVVATRVRNHREAIEKLGVRIIPLEAERRSLSPMELLKGALRPAAIIRREKPTIVQCVSVRQATLVGPIARVLRVPRLIVAPIGLGHLWIDQSRTTRVLRTISRAIIASLLRGPTTSYVFENREDPREFGLDPDAANVLIVGGAGVPEEQFVPQPEPPRPPFKVAVLARMTRPKGIPEAVKAATLARRTVPDLELHLFGDPDTSNPQALSQAELERLCGVPGVHWHGQVSGGDVPGVIARHHAVMLLSHREGLPRTLVEACASARAVVATDVTGCREIIRDGENGWLVPLGDVQAAAAALVSLAMDDARRAALARAGRARFEAQYSEAHVKACFKEFYRGALTEAPPSPNPSADEAEAGRRG